MDPAETSVILDEHSSRNGALGDLLGCLDFLPLEQVEPMNGDVLVLVVNDHVKQVPFDAHEGAAAVLNAKQLFELASVQRKDLH